jgi:hypothetical protein
MGTTVTQCAIEAVVERSEPQATVEPARRHSSGETEADKVRRQQLLRRKTKRARHALTANRR